MKKCFNLIAYLAIVLQVFAISIPIFDNVIMGYSLKYLFYYGFIFFSIGNWMIKKIFSRYIALKDFCLLLFIVCPYIFGIVYGWNFSQIVIESVLFLMPIAVYAWQQTSNIDKDKYVDLFLVVVIIAAIVSGLVAFRVISTSIWAPDGQLVRSAGAVDGTIFIGGYIFSFVNLFMYPSLVLKRKVFYIISFVGSIVGIMFGQSRARIVLVLMLTILGFVINMFNRKSKLGNFRFIGYAIIGICIVVAVFPEYFQNILQQVYSRFNTMSDGNIVYRNTESSLQISEFLENPLFGKGWGSRSQYETMYAHNIYTTLLMQCGLCFSGCLGVWFLSFIVELLKSIKKIGVNKDTVLSFCIIISLIILGISSAGFVQSGGYFMLIFVFLVDQEIRNKNKEKLV